MRATASENGGSITNVQFRVGAGVVTNDTTAPYFATTNNPRGGQLHVSAIASDSSGTTATNSVNISVVTPVAVSLSNSAAFSGTNFQFSYLVNTGLSYVVQRSSTSLRQIGLAIVTNVAASNPVVFVGHARNQQPRFYRVGRMPNP